MKTLVKDTHQVYYFGKKNDSQTAHKMKDKPENLRKGLII
jgi:hypothetical protein